MKTLARYGEEMSDLGVDTGLEAGVSRDEVRGRIIAAAAELLAEGGRDAATTRAVAAAAAVQAPTIYRLFGDMRGLLDAVAEQVLAAYIAEKSAREPHPDPVQDLRDGWDMHVAFGVAHPALFEIISSVPHARRRSPAADAGIDVLKRRVRNIARAGRLRVSEARAVGLLQAAGTGTVLTLLAEPDDRRDPGLSATAREAVLAHITTEVPVIEKAGPAAAAIALRAVLQEATVLTANERLLLEEWLDRLADTIPT